MKQFNLNEWLQDKSRKVVTRDGREVDIYYSPTSRISLIGRTSDNYIYQYTKDGFQCDTFNQAKNDLFFADEEEELTEFEKALSDIIGFWQQGNHVSKDIKIDAKNLLDLAREKDWREPVGAYKNGYEQGKQDALKDLPKWKKAHEHKEFPLHVCVIDENMYPFLDTEVNEGDYYIELSDLKTLPKEE